MSSVESNRMSKKTPSQDLNSELGVSIEAYQEAAKSDAFLFGEYNAYEVYDMPKNQLNKEELKTRIYKLKNRVDQEPPNVWQGDKDLAHKYLNWVLDIVDEYRY